MHKHKDDRLVMYPYEHQENSSDFVKSGEQKFVESGDLLEKMKS